jgi:hypothetical protein
MRQRPAAEEPAPPENVSSATSNCRVLMHHVRADARHCARTTRAGITPLIAIAWPVIAVALTVAFTVPRGQRRAVWAAVGFNLRRGRGLLIGVLGPAAIIAVSFGVAAAFGVVQSPGLPPGFGRAVLNVTVTIIIFSVVFLGEEIGWRGLPAFSRGRVSPQGGARPSSPVSSMQSFICRCCCSPPPTRTRESGGSSYRW